LVRNGKILRQGKGLERIGKERKNFPEISPERQGKAKDRSGKAWQRLGEERKGSAGGRNRETHVLRLQMKT